MGNWRNKRQKEFAGPKKGQWKILEDQPWWVNIIALIIIFNIIAQIIVFAGG